MQNLAGSDVCDKFIKRELEMARIGCVKASHPLNSEVPYSLGGAIKGARGSVEFFREATTWRAEGRFPTDLANEVWADPCGKHEITPGRKVPIFSDRVDEPGRRDPLHEADLWVLPDGSRILPLKAREEADRMIATNCPLLLEIARQIMKTMKFSDHPYEFDTAVGYITVFQIHSLLALRIFSDACVRHFR